MSFPSVRFAWGEADERRLVLSGRPSDDGLHRLHGGIVPLLGGCPAAAWSAPPGSSGRSSPRCIHLGVKSFPLVAVASFAVGLVLAMQGINGAEMVRGRQLHRHQRRLFLCSGPGPADGRHYGGGPGRRRHGRRAGFHAGHPPDRRPHRVRRQPHEIPGGHPDSGLHAGLASADRGRQPHRHPGRHAHRRVPRWA